MFSFVNPLPSVYKPPCKFVYIYMYLHQQGNMYNHKLKTDLAKGKSAHGSGWHI